MFHNKTAKFLSACRYISSKYHKPLYEVLIAETAAENVYLELEGDGREWDTKAGAWVVTNAAAAAEVVQLTGMPVTIRIDAEDAAAGAIAEMYIADALLTAGATVGRSSGVKPKREGEGVFVYVEVTL